MFPIRKLGELSPRTRLRKIARILQAAEISISHGQGFDAGYLRDLGALAGKTAAADLGSAVIEASALSMISTVSSAPDASAVHRAVNRLRNDILAALGAEPSEWDFLSAETGALMRNSGPALAISAYLEDIRSPFNVGSIFRTAEAFGFQRMILSPRTPRPDHPRALKTARGAQTVLPWEMREISGLRGAPGVFALELGGADIGTFSFPAEGTVLVGSEELGLSPEALEAADAGLGRVSIPLLGAKRSLNVSVAFGILANAWASALRKAEA